MPRDRDYLGSMTPVIALMRQRDQAERSAARLVGRGFGVVIAPATVVRAMPSDPPAGAFDAVVATSANAIVHGDAALVACIMGLPLYAVGERSREAASARGLALAAPPALDVAALLETLRARLMVNARVLYLAGRDRRPELEDGLRAAGCVVTAFETYSAEARERWDADEVTALAGADAFLHYSRRSAELTAALAARAGLLERLKSRPQVCMSRDTAAPLAALPARRVFWPHEPTEDCLLDTLESALADWIPR